MNILISFQRQKHKKVSQLILFVCTCALFQVTIPASELAGVAQSDKHLVAKKEPVQDSGQTRSRMRAQRRRTSTLVNVQSGSKSARKKINHLREEEIKNLTSADFFKYVFGKGELLKKRWETLPIAQRVPLAMQLADETKPTPDVAEYAKKIIIWRNFQAQIRREAARPRSVHDSLKKRAVAE